MKKKKERSLFPSRFLRIGILTAGLLFMVLGRGYSLDIELDSIGIRGGLNSDFLGIPPAEKEDFEQYDVFAVIGLPWKWDTSSGWEIGFRLFTAAGVLRAAGDTGFITELTPDIAFTYPDWRLTVDFGGGWAYLSDYEFGRQNIGGPFQIIGHGGISFHLPWNFLIGWRFHHMSDATIYGTDNRGVDLHMLELSYRF